MYILLSIHLEASAAVPFTCRLNWESEIFHNVMYHNNLYPASGCKKITSWIYIVNSVCVWVQVASYMHVCIMVEWICVYVCRPRRTSIDLTPMTSGGRRGDGDRSELTRSSQVPITLQMLKLFPAVNSRFENFQMLWCLTITNCCGLRPHKYICLHKVLGKFWSP